ncbi:hypothetical protein [Roseibacillus ishigakijimensis]|uniref:Peptidase C-terminal archaeal/bacterial domain-containing protein n=1 Tax=Roseibacillus ishigakijimensis TaxID=454146 RepID=A0A934RQB4_9BACT|nr:hypothetical protein [Roseibacillus ishigakijimensis]MBK1833651.1 hypothetical protein [Roseibacillus ishigakijimensis]
MKKAEFLFLVACGSGSLGAQYVVDSNLGTLAPSGVKNVQGNTSGSGGPVRNRADFHTGNRYFENGFQWNFEGNWGHERVYRFELTAPAKLYLSSSSLTGDPDFFLLEVPDVVEEPLNGKKKAIATLAMAPQDFGLNTEEYLGGYPPGIYYLVAESFDGFDHPENEPVRNDVQFSSTLAARSASALDLAEHLGTLSTPNQFVRFSTISSTGNENAAILGLYRESGEFLAATVGGDDVLASEGLEAGDYFLAVANEGSTFGEDFAVVAAGSNGPFQLNVSQGRHTEPLFRFGFFDFSFAATSVKFYRFTIAEPPAYTDLGVLVRQGEPLELSFLASNFDTEIAVYDQHGFFFDRNDDYQPGVTQSLLQYSQGGVGALPVGVWYLTVGGYDLVFREHFVTDIVNGATTEGEYVLNYNGQTESGVLAPVEQAWFRFEVGPPVLELADFSFDSGQQKVQLSWEEGSPNSTYSIYRSVDGVEFTLVPGQEGMQSLSTSFHVDLSNEPKQFFQVRED